MRIVMETSVAAGIRRIEAVTAAKADKIYYDMQDMLRNLQTALNNAPDLMQAIHKTIEENAGLKKQTEELFKEKAEMFCKELINHAIDYNGIRLVRLDSEVNPELLRTGLTLLRNHVADTPLAIIGATQWHGKPMISVFLSQPLVDRGLNAGAMVKSAARLIQGGGGGQPWMATAGGRDINGLSAALDELQAAL